MENSKNKKVQNFLNDIKMLNDDKYSILQKLREMVIQQFPEVGERIMYGGIMFSLEEDFGGVFVYKKHISFEFGNGATMKDPKGLLEGSGKLRRHLKFSSLSDITDKDVVFFLKQVP
jgi:hypothetical protein